MPYSSISTIVIYIPRETEQFIHCFGEPILRGEGMRNRGGKIESDLVVIG
jgi:hypothetical protein